MSSRSRLSTDGWYESTCRLGAILVRTATINIHVVCVHHSGYVAPLDTHAGFLLASRPQSNTSATWSSLLALGRRLLDFPGTRMGSPLSFPSWRDMRPSEIAWIPAARGARRGRCQSTRGTTPPFTVAVTLSLRPRLLEEYAIVKDIRIGSEYDVFHTRIISALASRRPDRMSSHNSQSASALLD